MIISEYNDYIEEKSRQLDYTEENAQRNATYWEKKLLVRETEYFSDSTQNRKGIGKEDQKNQDQQWNFNYGYYRVFSLLIA